MNKGRLYRPMFVVYIRTMRNVALLSCHVNAVQALRMFEDMLMFQMRKEVIA